MDRARIAGLGFHNLESEESLHGVERVRVGSCDFYTPACGCLLELV